MNCTKYALTIVVRQLLFYILQNSKPKTIPFCKPTFTEANKKQTKWDFIVWAISVVIFFANHFNFVKLF